MARLIGILANRPDLTRRFALRERLVLAAANPEGAPWGWGVGFQQHGEFLLRRRPVEDRRELDLGDMLGDVTSDLLLAHVRRATIGARSTDNTHPFRYQQFLFAETGTITGFGDVRARMLESVPEFLRRGQRGDTDGELLFHLFLSFLHDAGKLDDPDVKPRAIFAALAATIDLVRRLAREASLSESRINVMVASPEGLVAARFGTPMAYRVLSGRQGLEPLFAGEDPGKVRMPDLEACRLAVVASDFENDAIPEGWTALADGAMLALSRTDAPLEAPPHR